jgi:hypothetical protein
MGVGAFTCSRQSWCNVPEFILTVLLLELTPGPNMAYLATLTLDRGRHAGLLATAGVAAGLSVHAVVAAFGLGVLINKAPLIYNLLRWTGVAYLLYLAWETWQSNGKTQSDMAAAPSSFAVLARVLFQRVQSEIDPVLHLGRSRIHSVRYRRIRVAISGRAAGDDLHRDCNLYPCEYRVARGPAEIAADCGVPPKINSADTFSCPGAGRCLARLVDAPDMTGLLSD